MTREREDQNRAAWEGRDPKAWDVETHGLGLMSLFLPAPMDLKSVPHFQNAKPLATPDHFEFRLERAESSGRLFHAIVCEGIVVEKIEVR
jgi:hypothetical protein